MFYSQPWFRDYLAKRKNEYLRDVFGALELFLKLSKLKIMLTVMFVY